MDVSYLAYALQKIKNEDAPNRHAGTQEALDWVIGYVDAHWYELDALLDQAAAGLCTKYNEPILPDEQDRCSLCEAPNQHGLSTVGYIVG